jgi:GntR family transcriptional regulator
MPAKEFLDPEHWLTPRSGPRYLQLRKHLERAILSGELPPDSALPSEREIAQITGLSRDTVRKAVESLVADGRIIQRRGSGSFVAAKMEKVQQSLSQLTSFSEDMAQRGKVVESVWLERGVFLASAQEMDILQLPDGASVARIARLRLADGVPLAIERASLPLDILPNPLIVETSLYEILAQRNLRPVRALQRISAKNLGQQDAALLRVEDGVAGLTIERTSYLATGQVVEFTKSIYRGDAYDFVAELQISG